MANKYPGQCRCGVQVAAGAGHVQKIGRRWVVSCEDCGPTADRSSRRDNSSFEDRQCGDMAYEDRCAEMCGF